jgi:hypothetical protein
LPLVRKIIEAGKTSRAVIIPKSWLEFYEKQQRSPIEFVAIEVNRVLKIEPILSRKNENQVKEGVTL